MEIDRLELLDWKRRIFALYQDVRGSPDPLAAWRQWRGVRDELFFAHPQSPVPAPACATFPVFDLPSRRAASWLGGRLEFVKA